MRLTTQVNLPKMLKGDLDAAFLIVYDPQGPHTPAGYAAAYKQAIEKFDAIHRLTQQLAPDAIRLALTPADVVNFHRRGLRIAVIGIENGYPIGTDLSRVKEFYDRGARYMSLAHTRNSQLADSNTGEAQGYAHNNGLSPLARPVIASHSAVRSLVNVSRNMDDEQLLALKNNGGVIQIVAYASHLLPNPVEHTNALEKLREEFRVVAGDNPSCPTELQAAGLSPERRAEYSKRLAQLSTRWPGVRPATVRDLVDHVDYAVKRIGIDHVGISSDFDGGGGIEGWADASETLNVTAELVRRGYTEAEIAKLWGGNLLRVWREVEAVAANLQKR
jgi:membrane dipeptidase